MRMVGCKASFSGFKTKETHGRYILVALRLHDSWDWNARQQTPAMASPMYGFAICSLLYFPLKHHQKKVDHHHSEPLELMLQAFKSGHIASPYFLYLWNLC